MRFTTIPLLSLAAVWGAAGVHGQEVNLARAYHMVPRAGMAAQFETALRAHAQWRVDNNDPWQWGVSMYDTGEHFGTYSFFSSGHAWDDFDEYDAGFGPQGLLHWQATVAPLVESTVSMITAANNAISRFPTGPVSVVTVTRFQVRPGQEQRFLGLVSQAMGIVGQDLGGAWFWRSPAWGGGLGAWWELVSLYPSWGAMQKSEPTFESLMISELGEDGFQNWIQKLAQTFASVEVTGHRTRPDLVGHARN